MAETASNTSKTPAKKTAAPAAPTVTSTEAPDKADHSARSEDAGNIATAGDVISSTAVEGTDQEEHKAALESAGSWDAKDHVIEEGNFHDPALQGAGTILPDGSYGPSLPDPQVQRKNADPDYQVK